MLAKVVGDAEIVRRSRRIAFARRDLGASLAIESRMAPGQDVEAYSLAFFRDGGKAR